MEIDAVHFFEPIKGQAILTNFNQTAEKKAFEWPLFAELCTDKPLCGEEPMFFHVDEIKNATLKIGVYSPVAKLERPLRTDSPNPSERITSPVLIDGKLWYWNMMSVRFVNHWTAEKKTHNFKEINRFYSSSKKIKEDSLLGVCRKNNGDLHFIFDGTDMGIAARRVPYDVYGFIRIAVSGSSGRIKITLQSCKPADLSDFNIIKIKPDQDKSSLQKRNEKAQRPTDAPKNIRELYVTATSLTLGFDRVTDGGSNGVITGYRVYYRAETGTDDSTKTLDISKSRTQFVLSGLKENIMYRVRMTALNSAGESPQSQPTLSTTTKSGTDGHPVLLQRYNMSSRPRGFCVIINNKTFPTQSRRRNGAEKDEKILKTLFTKLHFIVDLKSDLTRNEILAMMEHYGSKTDHCRYNAFICIIMSHGRENDCIEGVDEKTVRVEDIMAEFDAQHCPSLEAKPKLFFIQSCRGGSWDNQCYFVNNFSALNCSIQNDGSAIQVDSTLPRSVCPKGADFLLAFATTPGYVALRTPSEGSFYIRILADVIGKLHKDVHLLDMLTVVNRKVSEEVFALTGGKQKQIPAPAFTLRKQVYL